MLAMACAPFSIPYLHPMADLQRLTSVEDVRSFFKNHPGAAVLDLRAEAAWKRGHLPGAQQALVHAMDFVDQVRKALPDTAQTILLYAYSGDEQATQFAAYKLGKVGYGALYAFAGGVDAWRAAGEEVVVEADAEDSPALEPLDGELQVDAAASSVEWSGRNIGSRHWGVIPVAEGALTFREDKLHGVRIVMDMTGIESRDIEDSKLAQVLNAHLKNEDFFEVDLYPKAEFASTLVELVAGASPGSPNYKITGDMSLKGRTHSVTFFATVGRNYEGKLSARARFDLDRTRWGILYGSGKLFKNLGAHLVADFISLEIQLVA